MKSLLTQASKKKKVRSKIRKNTIDFLGEFLQVIIVLLYIFKEVIVHRYSSDGKIVSFNMYVNVEAIQPVIMGYVMSVGVATRKNINKNIKRCTL